MVVRYEIKESVRKYVHAAADGRSVKSGEETAFLFPEATRAWWSYWSVWRRILPRSRRQI